jgi:peptide chain release factor 1
MSRLPLQSIIEKNDNLVERLSSPDLSTDDIIKLSKEQKKIGFQSDLATKILALQKAVSENEELLSSSESDKEIIDLTREDTEEKKNQISNLESELLLSLSPEDPRDDNDVFLEIRAGAGGDESGLFAAELCKAYSLMAQKLGFSFKIISSSSNDLGGFKEVIIEVKGEGVFGWFKYERGVHRVQRVPATEKQGRVHTSTVAVAVMPLVEKTSNFKLDPKEIEITATTSSGKGGQSVNTTYSAIKIRHLPTGIEAQSQDERSQQQNKEKALQVLTSRVYDHYEEERLSKEAAVRKEQVGNMDRSEKIRTYNFPQDRLTDHRYNNNWSQLSDIFAGKIQDVIIDIKRFEAENSLQNLNI